jgi:hypothetical protein
MKFVKSPAVPGFFYGRRRAAAQLAAGKTIACPCFYCSNVSLKA